MYWSLLVWPEDWETCEENGVGEMEGCLLVWGAVQMQVVEDFVQIVTSFEVLFLFPPPSVEDLANENV
jgi:hypothetical protein